MKMNQLMLNHFYSAIKDDNKLIHNPRIDELVNSPFVQQEECVFLYVLLKNNSHYTRKDFPDRTAYEAFINHIHITDFIDETELSQPHFLLKQGFALAHIFRMKLARAYPDKAFLINLSYDEMECTVRFYCARDDEPSWLAGDLDGYKEEAILVLAVQPAPVP